ncbi:MAG: arginase family protein [Chitinophagaceae bacterium]|jgi:arginase family enzyme|nr:arginase family protein [Chitinophagaceae bacterium]
MLFQLLQELVDPVNPFEVSEDEGYRPGQIGYQLTEENDLDGADLILLGCDEWRGMGQRQSAGNTAAVRRQLYTLFLWHGAIRIADAGTLRSGSQLTDTYAAARMVIRELLRAGKRVLLFGGSHDISLALYQAFAEERQLIECTAVDALIDLDREQPFPAHKFLLDMLTSEPNYVKQFNLVGFQSYFVNPQLLETIDKLRFDCFRVGKVQEKLEEVEPSIRSSHLFSFDLNALAHAYAPVNSLSPNGFTGQEACKLMQYAGMSGTNRVSAIHGFWGKDPHGLTAMQVAHMIWYFIDGIQKQLHETPLEERQGYNEYHTLCAEVDTLFLQSRNTGRWWMQLPDQSFIPCTYTDYLVASHNDLPERWLRAQERM